VKFYRYGTGLDHTQLVDSILLGQKESRAGSVRFSYQPKRVAGLRSITADDAESVLQAVHVLSQVLGIHVSPIARNVAEQKLTGRLVCTRQGFQSAGRGNDLT
jgi:hypothetical protein